MTSNTEDVSSGTDQYQKIDNDIDNHVHKFQQLMDNMVRFQEKMSERTSDLMEMVSIVETLILNSEERFQQINNQIIQIIDENKDEKKSIDVIMREFDDLRSDVVAIKHMISQKTKAFFEDVLKKAATEEAAEIKKKLATDSQSQDELTIYALQEKKILNDLQGYLQKMKEFKHDVISLEKDNTVSDEIKNLLK